jgi:uncharacterized protein with HEPN domain
MDKSNNKELLKFILDSITMIKERFDGIECSDDFLGSKDGMTKLDSISMRLQSIGEALKNIDKRDRTLLLKVADKTYWSNIIKTREIITHHYIDIDSETIFMICDEKINDLENKVLVLLNKIDEDNI